MSMGYAIRKFKCAGCGASVEKRAPPGTKYCSLLCYRSSPRPQKRTGFETTCGTCGSPVYVARSAKRDLNFCSAHCHNEYQGRNKTIHECETCGGSFTWSPSRIKHNNPRFCSIRCRNASADWRRKASTAANLAQQNRKGPNRLEQAGLAILDGLGLHYRAQVPIDGRFVVDVLLPELGVVIQWDGDYWHGYRAPGDFRPFDKRVEKRRTLDRSQDAYLKKQGFRILRFWEHEVHQQPETVRENIRRAVRSTAP